MIPGIPAGLAALAVGCAARGYALVAGSTPKDHLAASTAPVAVTARPAAGRVETVLDALAPRPGARLAAVLGPRRVEALRRRLDAAGVSARLTPQLYLGRTILVGGAATVVALLFAARGMLGTAAAALIGGWGLYESWLRLAARHRQARIEAELPDFLDVLAVTVAAGLGFRSALVRTAESLGGVLGDEFLAAGESISMGVSRRDALQRLRDRNPAAPLGRLVTAVLQSEELGAPLTDTIVAQAGEIRRERARSARRRAGRAEPRVTAITGLVLLPAVLILIVAAFVIILGRDFHAGLIP